MPSVADIDWDVLPDADSKSPSGHTAKSTSADIDWDVIPDDTQRTPTFLGELGRSAAEPFKSLAKSPTLLTMSDDEWMKTIQEESAKRRSVAQPGIAATAGRIAGSVVGGVGQFVGSEAAGTTLAAETGPAAPFIGLGAAAASFGASSAYETGISAGVRAYDQGLPKDKVVSIAKKMAGIGAGVGAATAIALPGSVSGAIEKSIIRQGGELIPRTATALSQTLKTAAGGATVGTAGQLVENVAEKEMGLDVSPTEGLLEQAVVMGLLPVVAHAKDLYRQARSVAKSDPAKAKALQKEADDVAEAELRKVDTTPSSETSLTADQQAKESAKAKVREFVMGSELPTPKGATAPRVEPPAAPETVTPDQAKVAKDRMSREATGVAGIEKESTVAVPSTEPEAERGINVLDEIKQSGARTIADIQRLFPQAQLSREAARKLRDQAWGKPEAPAPKAKPAETPPEDLTAKMESSTDESNVTVPVTKESSTGSAPNREPVAPTEPVEPKGKESNALVTEAAQPVQPVREQPVSGKGEVPEQSGLAPNDEGRGETSASQPETPAQPTTDPPTITADGPAGDWSYETLKALSVAQRGKLAGDLRRYTKDARLTDKTGLLELGPKKIAEVVKDLGERKIREAQEKASKPVEAPPVDKPVENVTTTVTEEKKAEPMADSPVPSDQQLLIDVPKSPKHRTQQMAQLRRLADKLEEEYNREDISLDRSRQLQDRQDKILRKLHELESQSVRESKTADPEPQGKVEPPKSTAIPAPPSVEFQHPAEGSPEANALNEKAGALQKQVDEAYSKMQQFKEQANNAGYGTKRRADLTVKADKARDQYDNLSRQYEPLREQRYQMTLEHVVRTGPPEARLAASVELLQRRKSPRFRDESDKAYLALRTEAENRLMAGGVDSKTAQYEALGLVSSVMSYPASEFGWFEKRIPETLDRLKEEKISEDRLAQAKALLQEYGVLSHTGFEAKAKAARDDAHFKAIMDEERANLKNEKAARQKVEAEKAEILKEQIAQELENAKQLQKEGKLFWRRWRSEGHARWSPIEGKPVTLDAPGEFFIYKGEKGWVVVESSTGLSVGNGKLRADAISTANANIQKVGVEKFQKIVAQSAKDAGPKPDLSKVGTSASDSETKPPEPTSPVEAKPLSTAEPTPDQKYRIGNNPSTYSLIERLPQSEAEKSNGEQPVRVKNDRTGVEETVLEQDLKPVNERTPEEKATAKESKRDLDAELREAKMDPSVFPDEASKREALRRAKAKGWEKFSMRPDSDRSSLEQRLKQYGDTREVQDRNLIDRILRPTLEKQAGQKLVLDPATAGETAQGRGELGAGVSGAIDARSTAAFERLFGKRLVFYRQSSETGAKAERHIYGYSTGRAADVIFVDANAPNTWLRVAGHELLHHINKERPDLYRELEDHFIKDATGKEQEAFDKYSNYPPEEITEEAVADLVGDSVADPQFWDRFASKNPGLFWRAAKTILDWLDKAAEWLKGTDFGSAEFTKDVDRARSVVADTLAKYSEGKQAAMSAADWEKFSAARPGTLPPEESKLRKVMDAAGDGLRKLRSTIAHSWATGDIRRAITSTRDAGDTEASLFGRKMANEIRQPMLREYGKPYQQRAEDALTFAVEAKGDINALNAMRDKILNSENANPSTKRRAVGAIDFAFDQWETLQKHAEKYKAITDYQVLQENARGIDTLMREGYVMHEQDVEFEPSIMTSRSGTGDATGFRKVREHDTYADSIAAGIDPKSLNAVDLLQARVRRGQQLINKRAWVDGLKTFVDPISHNPIATDPIIVTRADGSKYPQAPDGYTLEMIQRQPIAIHKGYEGIISALTDPSAFSRSLGAQSLMKWAGAGKSISLMFDTFHLGRVAFWDSLIKATGVKTFRLPFPSYRKGLTLADYTTEQIRTMAAHGEIPSDWVNGLEQEHARLGHLVKGGYNIGRISDSLYQDFIHNLPFVGKVNRWVFESFQRGAMAETGLLEFERLKLARPDMPDAEVGRQVARDLNTRFGNLGRQGLFKSRTFQDLARFLVLAPQWNEGLIRSELGAGKQAAQMVADLARGKSLYSGVLLRSVGGMALAQFTANQIINYITRGHPTWENPEEGMGAKLSAWIPDKLGSGSGFFLHPLGLAAETTHLLMRKFEQTGDFHSSLMNYLRSRSSTSMRPVMTFITNQDFLGRNLKPGTVWGQMALDAVPRPIGGQAYALGAKQAVTGKESESFAGQFEKQILSSVGIKTEGAPAPASRISSLAREFNRQKGIVPSAEFYSGDYQPLTSAVALGNEDAAKDAMTELLKRKTPEQVRKYMATWTGHPFTGQRGRESQFRATLTPEQKEQYSKAIEQRRKIAQEVYRMLRE